MGSLYFIFYACLKLRFTDVETNPGPRRPVLGACRILCSNVRGLSKNLSDVTVAMICCCALRPWSRTGVIYQSCWFLYLVVLYCCAGMESPGPVGWLHMCEMDMLHFAQPKFECGCCEMLCSGCVVLDRTSTCSVCIATLT